ncbi:MAG: hypothetical protein J7M21_00275 [Planctomycetes bacterium]|nr:hypothetical protein [Planctomycetota bacterium]
MARRKKKHDDEPAGPGEWIVTFSDCMTLLLCFFVLLLTFSSFDEVELQKLAGAFNYQNDLDRIFPVPRKIKDSIVEPADRYIDMTEKGSETPTQSPRQPTLQPKRLPAIFDDDAYKDRRILYIPSEKLFWGEGTVLRPAGRRYLDKIASFLRMLPCRVVISETGPAPAPAGGRSARIDRAWAVMRDFTGRLKLPAERFNITAAGSAPPARLRGHRVVAIAMISRRIY